MYNYYDQKTSLNYAISKIDKEFNRELINICEDENIPAKYVPYLGIFKTLFRSLDTKNHTYQSLEQDININTGGISYSVMTNKKEDEYAELERSIVAKLADDIIVGVRGKNVEIVVKKSF